MFLKHLRITSFIDCLNIFQNIFLASGKQTCKPKCQRTNPCFVKHQASRGCCLFLTWLCIVTFPQFFSTTVFLPSWKQKLLTTTARGVQHYWKKTEKQLVFWMQKKNQGFPLLSCPKHSVNIIKQTPSVQWLLEMQTQHWRNTITTILFHSFACWSHFNTPYSHLNNSTLILLVVCRTQILSDAKDTKI